MREDEQLTPEKIRSYELALSGIKPASLERGMRSLIKRAVWFPTAAEIREACRQEAQNAELEEESRARRALPSKPPGWVPLKQLEEAPEFRRAVANLAIKPAAPVANRRVIVPLTGEQHNARMAELRRQAEQLGASK